MSPEQACGKPVDQRADIWAFGVVLYEMLTGKPAFGGEDVTTTLARVLERDPDLEALPASIASAVRQTLQLCLQKDVKKRVADIRDVRLALAGAFDSSPHGALAAAAARLGWQRARPVATGLVGALLAGAAVFTLTRPEPLPPPPVTRFLVTPPATAPLSNNGGLDLAISPDGTRLAYVGDDPKSGLVALYLRDADGLDARVVPGTEGTQGGAALNPFFSADGKWLGFNSPGRGIMRVAISGGPPLKMLDEPPQGFLGAAWAADDTLIFSTIVSLNRVSARGGGTPERLTPEPQAGGVVYIAPALLPGGRAVLFHRREGEVMRVAVLDLATGEQRILIEGGQNPTYAATGHIVFARGTTLMAVPFDLARLVVTGEPVALLQGVRQTAAADYALSTSGTLVYVPGAAVSTPTGALVWVDRTGRVTGQAVSEPLDRPRDPRLSPDGGRLVLTVLTTGQAIEGNLWIYDLGGRPPIPLADEGNSVKAVWSPDGAQVIFSSNRGGSQELYTAPADGSLDAVPLRRDKLSADPAVWSNEGELIVVGPLGDILATRVEPDAELRDLVATPDAEFDAALSANGRWLAYASNRTGRPEIWVKRYPDGVAVRISRDGGVEPRWSAEGRELFYLQGSAMMAVAVETEGEFAFDAAVALFADPSFFVNPGQFVHSYDVARDGRFLMIQQSGVSTDTAGSIVVVQNWFEELKQRVPTE
jgi:Tol biopolymer transport system component